MMGRSAVWACARSAWPDAEPKTGTVTMDVTKAVKDIKGGKIEFRVDRTATSFLIGKMSR